jgi:hypothetical protein
MSVTTSGRNERFRVGAWSGLGFVVLFLVGAVVSNVATTEVYPRPGDTAAEAQAYFADNQGITEVLSLTQAGSAACLAVFAGVVAVVIRRRDLGGSREAAWCLVGGGLAAALLLFSAIVVWALSREPVAASAPAVGALHQLAFAAGGAGHVVPLGILIGAASIAALRSGLHARWLARSGLASAAVCLMSVVTLVALGPLVVLIAVGRFSAFVYVVAAGFLMREVHAGDDGATVPGDGQLVDASRTRAEGL